MDFQNFLEEYNKAIENEVVKIKELISSGKDVKSVFLNYGFNYESLRRAGLPVSYLIPTFEKQNIDLDELEFHIPNEGKWEYFNGYYFDEVGYGEEVLLMMLLSKIGLNRLIEILPEESINNLKTLLEVK